MKRKKQRKKRGFSLIEFLIYFALIAILSTLIIDFLMTRYAHVMRYSRQSDQYMSLCAVQDLITRDIHHGCASDSQLIIRSGGEYIVSGIKDIGWQVKKNRLIRSEGVYNKTENIWKQRTKGVVAEHIAQVSFDVQKTGTCIDALRCTINTIGGESMTRIITLRNRIFYA